LMAKGYGNANQQMDAADPKADHYDFPPAVMKLADRKLAGKVLGTNGQPVAGCYVNIYGEGQPNGNVRTDAKGQFTFDAVCEGPVQVSANSQNSSGFVQTTGGDTNVVIRFNANNVYVQAASLTLTGTVSDSAGNPASGIQVSVMPTLGMIENITTDESGGFTIHWQARQGNQNAKYFAVARDPNRNLVAIEEIDEKKTQVSLKLQSGLTISGTVQDSSGTPLPRANINLNMMAGNMGTMLERRPVSTDSDGAFTIAALPLGQEYRIYVTAKDYGSANRAVGKPQTQTNGSIQLPVFNLKLADRELAGQVQDADGKPLSGMQVMINGNGQPSGNTRSDATGHFKFKVCDGPITVNAFPPQGGRSTMVQARGGDTDVVVKMGTAQQLRQQPQRRALLARATPLKPQPWTFAALATWPKQHKTGVIILLGLQAAVLLGTGAGIFWFTRKRT
jgi:protocatechuate 3,4-dioxygenase beta subunit